MHLLAGSTLDTLIRDTAENGVFHAEWTRLIARVDAWCAAAPDIPTQSGGWIHNYICPTTWLPLIYDGDKGNLHRSPVGDRVEGDIYDEAWLAWRHRQFADMAREVALAYLVTHKPAYLAEVERIILAYLGFYADSEGADSARSWMIKGRVFNQALTESLWATPLIFAYDLVALHLAPELREQITSAFLRPLAATICAAQDELIAKDHVESNYMAWFNIALGSLGYTLGDDELVHRAIDGEGGFVRHISAGVLADGMQYEVTPYYHNFVVLAYVLLAEVAAANGRDLYAVVGEQGQTLQSMWRSMIQVELPDGRFADLGDGSYWIDSVYDRELVEVYEIALARDEDNGVANILRNAYARHGKGRDHYAALLYGNRSAHTLLEQARRKAETQLMLPDAGVGLLQASSKMAAVLPFGAHRGSHSHGDQLSLQVWPFSNDAGCVLYGIDARRAWYQDSYAHNVLVVDGQTPKTFAQATVLESAHAGQLALEAVDAYGDCAVARRVSVDGNCLMDMLSVSAEISHTYDFVFHVDGDLRLDNLQANEIDAVAAATGGGQFIKLTGSVSDIDSAEFSIQFNNETYYLTLQGAERFELLLGNAPGSSWDPTARRHVIIGRTVGQAQTYRMRIRHD